VSVLVTEIIDVAFSGFEDPQPQKPQHGDNREVVVIDRLS
jgi:hypothetical protein